MGNALGQQVQPNQVNPLVGLGTQGDILNALLGASGFGGGVGAGSKTATISPLAPFTSANMNPALSPDVSQTILPQVGSSWQPMDAGTMFLANQLYNGGPLSNPTAASSVNPALQSMMKSGGTGGPGNTYMNLAAQYGTPSAAGQYEANMAQYGEASQGSGGAQAALASGSSPLNSFLLPYMQNASPYKAPSINYQPKTGATL